MTVTATYDDTAGKVTVAVSAAPSNAAAVMLERSTDQVGWTQVRGAQLLTIAAGAASIADYEYQAGVANYYRASYISAAVTAVGGSTVSGQTATSVPATTTINVGGVSAVLGDTIFVAVSLSAAPTSGTITCTTAGWSITNVGTLGAVLRAPYSSTLANPVVGVTVASSTALSWYGFRYINASASVSASQVNTAATSIAYPASPAQPSDAVTAVLLAARAAAFVAPAVPTATFSDATKAFVAYHNASGWAAGAISFGGGTTSAASWEYAAWLRPASYILRESGTVTPAQTGIWLKNPLRPFLNRRVEIVDFTDLTRSSRSGLFDVIGRTLPIGVTDLMSGRSTTITLRTLTAADADDLEDRVAVGEVMLLQPPYQAAPPTLYGLPTGLTRSRVAQTSAIRRFVLPLTEVAAPDPGLAAVQSTWQTVINTYSTWADLVAAKAAWTDVLQLVGTAADVITS